MNINHIKEFIALSESESFAEAAENSYTTQSTVSKHIKKMEQELGVTLFDRTSRTVRLSECGEILLPFARQIDEIERAYLSALAKHSRLSSDSLTIGSITNLVAYGISDILVGFQNEYPTYQIDISGGSPYDVYKNLYAGRYDLAFLRYTDRMDISGLSAVPFAEDEIVAVCSKYHPLAEHKVISLGALRDERILLYSPNSFMHDFIINACTDAGFKPNVALTVHRTENLVELASQQLGICFLMGQHMSGISNPNIAAIRIDPPYGCRIDLCYKKGQKPSIPAQNFLKFVSQHER
ncbi:LysR family transcriptional regulator [Eubacteriales bacterium OttesenSCG-928-A19]|nr:LysR family transcriptional regulator [Eubacteriales bacterium OttesenSCG-928-A19]